MRILFSLDNFDHSEGGAEKSTQAITAMLAAAGHEVAVLQTGPAGKPCARAGATVHCRPVGRPPLLHDREPKVFWQNHRWQPLLRQFLDEHPAELIFTQHRLSPSTVDVARQCGVPVVTFVRAYGMLCPEQFRRHDPFEHCDRRCFRCLPWRQKLKYPLVRAAMRKLSEALRQSDLVIANSDYVRRVVERFCQVSARVLHPPVDLAAVRVERGPEAKATLFVKPQVVKGAAIFEALARAMPEKSFLVAGRLSARRRARLARLANVQCLGWLEDMRLAYARTRVLLAPALWPEPFGRVFVEAASSGIPAVASRVGGIPEAVGDGGMLVADRHNVEAWVDALNAMKNPGLYEELSRRARAHADQFAPDRSLATLKRILQETLGIQL